MNTRIAMFVGTAALSLAMATGRAEAQQYIFLEIAGVQGEGTAVAFANQIELTSASFAASNPACSKSSISVSEIIITKRTDKASVDLLTAMRDGTVYPTATIRFARTNDSQVYQKYELSNAKFSSTNAAGGASDLRTMESWTVSFSQVIITYTFIDAAGKVAGTENMTIVPAACPGS